MRLPRAPGLYEAPAGNAVSWWLAVALFYILILADTGCDAATAGGMMEGVRPHLRWAQTNATVFITLDISRLPSCATDTPASLHAGLSIDRISVSASCGESGEKAASDAAGASSGDTAPGWSVELREDIAPEASRIDRLSSGGLLLVLRKLILHRWDRLLWDFDDGLAIVSKDWKREDRNLPEEDEVELPRAQNIQQLTLEKLRRVASSNIVVAAMRYPWCTVCEEKDKAFVKATKIVGGKIAYQGVVFGALNLREEKTVGRMLGIASCKKDCPLHVFKPDEPFEEPYQIEMQLLYEMDEYSMMTDPMAGAPGHTPKGQNVKPNFDRFEQDLNRLMSPALTEVRSADELNLFRRTWDNVVVGTGINRTEFRRTARRLRGEAAFAWAEDSSLLGSSAGDAIADRASSAAVELWASAATPERLPVLFDGQLEPLASDDLDLFVRVHDQPLYQNYSWDLKSKLEDIGLPVAVLWVNFSDSNSSNVTQKAVKAFEGLCDRRRGRDRTRHVLCCLQDESYSYYQREYGSHEPYPYPFFGLTKKLGYGEGDRFGYPFKEPVNQSARIFFGNTKKALQQMNSWITKVLAGNVPPSHESGLLPAKPKWVRGEVQEVVWKTYQKEINRSTADVLIELYDDQRKRAHIADATMRMVAAAIKDYSTIKIARMETSQNYVPAVYSRKQYSKDTEYYWVPPSISTSEWTPELPVKYTGALPATPERLLRFLKKHSLAHWSLKEALEVTSDLQPEVMGQAEAVQREDDRADREKQEMIQKMMTTLKKEKGLVDVGEMMGLKKAAETMGVNEESSKSKQKKEKKPKKSTSKSAGSGKTSSEQEAVSKEKQKEAQRKKLKAKEDKLRKLEQKEKEKRKKRREADKKRQEKKKKEEAEAKLREEQERERKRKQMEKLRADRAMAPTTPFFSWGQLKEQVHVSISVPKLNPAAVNVTLKDDAVAVHAKDQKNRSFILEFELREFVVLENSSWTLRYSSENPLDPKPDGVMLSLGKVLAHRWDRLAQNHAAVKQFMRKDWVQDDSDLEEEEDVDLPSGPNIKKVTAAALRKLVNSTTLVVAALRFPWCDKCNEKDGYFAKAGRTIREKEHLGNVVFAVVDVREEKHLGRTHNATCDDQCKLLIFKQDEADDPYVVPGRRYAEEIQIDCYKHLLPVVSIVDEKDMFDRVTSAFDTAIVGFFIGTKEEDSWYPRFKAVARQLRGHALFGAVFGGREPRDFGIDHDATPTLAAGDAADESGQSSARPLILLFKPKEQRHVEFTGELTLSKLTHFSRVLSLPLVSTYEFEHRQKYQELKVPLGMMWLDGEHADREENTWAKEIVHRLALRFSGHLVFVMLNGTRDALLMRPMGLDPRRVPTFGIASSDELDSQKFGYDMKVHTREQLHTFWAERNATFDRLESFCASFLDGTLEQSHESAELPPTYRWPGPGFVHEAVWKTFREAVYRTEHDVLLELYSPFRPQHRTYLTALDLVAEALKELKGVKVVRMDTANNYVLPEFGLKDKEKASTFYFLGAAPERQRRPKRFGGKGGKAEALPEKLIRFVHRETRGHTDWDVGERVTWANREALRRIKRLRALEKDYEKKMQEEWMQKEMEEFERYKRLGKFDNLPPMG
mmetsp:Transcript_90781/g.157034  ORF Transcript_90781/g.157034 Transcript_90781/m.157034 type:complete len:1612 (-) Transcript_90781:46-4881(-)